MIRQSDTPRTDDAICGSEPFNDEHVVLADFASQLERENAAMREVIKEAYTAIATQIHVRGTSDDTLDVLAQQESALTKLSPFLQ